MSDISKVFIDCLGCTCIKQDQTLYIDSMDAFKTNLLDSLDSHLKDIKYKEIVYINYGLIVGITLDGDAMEISFNNSLDNNVNIIETFEKVNLPKKIKSVACIQLDEIGNSNCNHLSECSMVWIFEDATIQLNNLQDIIREDVVPAISSVNLVYSIDSEDTVIILCLMDDGTIKCISDEWLANTYTVKFDVKVAFSNVKQIIFFGGVVFIEYLDFKLRTYNIYLTDDITCNFLCSNRIPNDRSSILPTNISNALTRSNLIQILMFNDIFVYYFDDGTLLYKEIEIKCSIVFKFNKDVVYKKNDTWYTLSNDMHADTSVYDKIAHNTSKAYGFIGHYGEVYHYYREDKTLNLVNIPNIYIPEYFVGI